MRLCKLCRKDKTKGTINGYPVCCMCQFFLKNKKASTERLINKMKDIKIRYSGTPRDYLSIFVHLYPELVKGKYLHHIDIDKVRSDIYKNYIKFVKM